jgi:DNA-binding NarL/FixJ family response regulator
MVMIRVLVVDDHPAVRAGVVSLLRSEPGLVPVGAVGSAELALRRLARGATDVLLVDYDLPDSDGLALCWDAKTREDPPAVLIYSAFARPRLMIAATLAGADGVLDKGAPPEQLFELLRVVARGGRAIPRVAPELLKRCVAELDQDDIPLFGMAFNRIPVAEIAAVVSLDIEATRARLRALMERLERPSEARAA